MYSTKINGFFEILFIIIILLFEEKKIKKKKKELQLFEGGAANMAEESINNVNSKKGLPI